MTSFQKVIKYCAMAFAVFLAVGIIGGIISGIVGCLKCIIPNDGEYSSSKVSVQTDSLNGSEYADISSIKLDIGIYKVIVGGKDSIQNVQLFTSGVNDDLSVTANEGILRIKSEDEHWFKGGTKHSKGIVYVYVPKNQELNKLDIDSGVGNIKVSDMNIQRFNIDCGVGRVDCKNIVADRADIEGGVGSLTLSDVELNGLDLEGGVGSMNISGILTGRTCIEGGMGSVDVDITGKKDDYNIKSESGIGGVFVDGDKIGSVNYYSEKKDNILSLEGGMGSINVNFH